MPEDLRRTILRDLRPELVIFYDGFRSSVVAESRARRFDVGREFRPIERFLGRRGVLLRNDVVDRLFHCYYFLFALENTTDQSLGLFNFLLSLDTLTLLFFFIIFSHGGVKINRG